VNQNDQGTHIPEAENPEQIAPGAEAGAEQFGAPYTGWWPSQHRGYPLNESLFVGIEAGRY
jgi:hypothetical protein